MMIPLSEDSSVHAIGLMSGTSADGIDAVLVHICGCGMNIRVKQLAFITIPYDEPVRNMLLDTATGTWGGTEHVCKLNVLLGHLLADACEAVCAKAGISPSIIDFVGSHGHTVFHIPESCTWFGRHCSSTLQLGEASIIAERMHCPVVSDFRPRDMAAGGNGAPLVPYTEFLLYRNNQTSIALQNIGGIGNVTFLPAGCTLDQVVAFDTGPGNMVMDALAERISNGLLRYDHNGTIAGSFPVHERLLSWMLDDPYLSMPIPKTTGRERYGKEYVMRLISKAEELCLPLEQVLSTATMFTAYTISLAIKTHAPSPIQQLVVGGGGARNPVLISHIQRLIPECTVHTNEDLGYDSDAKEAVAFAILANETLHLHPGNAPSATGARNAAILGKITL